MVRQLQCTRADMVSLLITLVAYNYREKMVRLSRTDGRVQEKMSAL